MWVAFGELGLVVAEALARVVGLAKAVIRAIASCLPGQRYGISVWSSLQRKQHLVSALQVV